jgi:hypothetical protein
MTMTHDLRLLDYSFDVTHNLPWKKHLRGKVGGESDTPDSGIPCDQHRLF